MTLPVFVVHWGNSDYLQYCLRQAKNYNPDSPVYLLGDKSNNRYDFVSHHLTGDYSPAASEFEKVYKHLNSVPFYYVLFWYKRWFIIKDFLLKHPDINEFFYLDSDVLLFSDISKEFSRFQNEEITICGARSPHCTFFNSRDALFKFTEYLMQLYTAPALHSHIVDIYNKYTATGQPGGIDDMTAFYEYKMMYPGRVGNCNIVTDGSCFERNMSYAEDFEYYTKRSIKKIHWQNGIPYGKRTADGSLIRFHALHFQGGAKRFMHRYYTGGGYRLKRIFSEGYYAFYLPVRKILSRIYRRFA